MLHYLENEIDIPLEAAPQQEREVSSNPRSINIWKDWNRIQLLLESHEHLVDSSFPFSKSLFLTSIFDLKCWWKGIGFLDIVFCINFWRKNNIYPKVLQRIWEMKMNAARRFIWFGQIFILFYHTKPSTVWPSRHCHTIPDMRLWKRNCAAAWWPSHACSPDLGGMLSGVWLKVAAEEIRYREIKNLQHPKHISDPKDPKEHHS